MKDFALTVVGALSIGALVVATTLATIALSGGVKADVPDAGPIITTEAPATQVRVVEVTLNEFSISPIGPIEAGETIEFVVTNEGVVPHEFEITDEHAVEQHMAGGHDDHDMVMDDDMDMDMDAESKISVAPGGTEKLVVTFDNPEEQNLAVCLLPDHYEAGMTTAL